MKFVPETKHEKRNKTTSKKLTITSYQQIVTSLLFFQFTSNLEQSGSRIPHTQSLLMISLIVIVYLTKSKNKKIFFAKYVDIRKIKTALVQKVYFLKLLVGVYLRAKFQVSCIILTSFRHGEGWRVGVGGRGLGVILLPLPQAHTHLKTNTYKTHSDSA